jgi:hypothetical protein
MVILIRNLLSLSILSTLFITGCAGLSDYSYDVAGNYELVRSSGHQIAVIQKNESNVPGNMIPPKVVKIAWNERYVIAEQQGLKRRNPNDPNDMYEEPTDAFYYWLDIRYKDKESIRTIGSQNC